MQNYKLKREVKHIVEWEKSVKGAKLRIGLYWHIIIIIIIIIMGHAIAQLVEALRCKPEGRGFDSRWCHWNFSPT